LQSCWEDKPEKRPTFSEILQTLEWFLETTADYIDLGALMIEDDYVKDENNQAYYVASPTEASLKTRTAAPPNDYCTAGQQ